MALTRNKETKTRLTRKQRVIVALLIVFLIVPQCYLLVIQIRNPKSPTIQVSDVRINIKTKEDAVVFMVITLSSGKKYGAHVTIPIYSLTKEGETDGANQSSRNYDRATYCGNYTGARFGRVFQDTCSRATSNEEWP